MKNIIKHKDGHLSWVLWIKKRIKNNLNFNSITTGETGCGKSWFDLSLAYAIDPEFEVRQIAFNFERVMEIIQSDWFNKKKYKIIIFEEVQTSISNREWQGLVNKLFNYLLSTYRHRNIIMLMNSPYTDFIDSHTRKLIHVVFEIRGHNEKTKKTQVRPKILQYNSKLKKFYEHSLYVIRNRTMNKQINLLMDMPPKHLIKPYEAEKLSFTTALNDKIIEDLKDYQEKAKFKKGRATEVNWEVFDLWKKYGEKAQKVRDFNGMSLQNIYKHIRRAKLSLLNQKPNPSI